MKAAALLSIVALACFTELAYGLEPPANPRILNPDITAQSQNQTVIAGQSATFTVAVTGNVKLSYRWTFNGSNVGSSSSAYTRANCQLADNGGRVQVTVSNSSGSVQSSTATLTVNPTGTIYYVAPSGSSSNTGLSTNSPWILRKGIFHLGPDVTVIMMSGAYAGPVTIYNITNGTAGHPATLKSQTKWGAVIANSTKYGIQVWNASNTPAYLILDGLCVSNSAGNGIWVLNPKCTVRNCWLVNNGGFGLNIEHSNSVVEYNLIELSGHGVGSSSAGHGIYISDQNSIIHGNVIRHNGGFGMQLYTRYSSNYWQNGNQIYNNVFQSDKSTAALAVYGADDTGGSGTHPGTNSIIGNTIIGGLQLEYGTACVTNNIILPSSGHSTIPIWDPTAHVAVFLGNYNLGTNTLLSSNTLAGNGCANTYGLNDVVTNTAGFVSSGFGLYYLRADSPARGAAFPTGCRPVDFFGNAQSSVTDIGAFQYNATLAGDIRVLDPSPANPDYWSLP